MNPLDNPLDGFSPELYIATLAKLAHSDGIHSDEKDILDQHAARFGIELGDLPDVPEDLTELPWATRVLVYRDALMLSMADEDTSDEERKYLDELAERMKLPYYTIDSISTWVQGYGMLLEQLDDLMVEPTCGEKC